MATVGTRARLRTRMAALVAWIAGEASPGAASRPAAESSSRSEFSVWSSDALACERDAGGRRAEWELARAAEYGREVALALVGVDFPAQDADAHLEHALMRRLDDVILRCVTRFDVLSEYGRHERLLVLPEESAARLASGAAEICELATRAVGRPVRMALAGFPAQGPTLRALLTELEIDLAECRAHGASVLVAGAATRPLAAAITTISLRPLSHEPRPTAQR
ncbi:MAG: hypothetical protein E6J41_13175 [Chloroflexi bacterium]|nr:MAG: hypothetical protein E6J41_13175 [Chloroflexota bacterium]